MKTGYFIKLSRVNQPKNKLCKVTTGWITQNFERCIVEDAQSVFTKLVDKIEELNKRHKRCTPLRVATYEIGDGGFGVSVATEGNLGWELTLDIYLNNQQ